MVNSRNYFDMMSDDSAIKYWVLGPSSRLLAIRIILNVW